MTPSMTLVFKFQLLPRMEGFLICSVFQYEYTQYSVHRQAGAECAEGCDIN
jgi:hypothetical protein